MRNLTLACVVLLAASARLPAQTFTTTPCSADDTGNANSGWSMGHQERVCELRRTTLPLVNNQLAVAGKNGGIEVVGEDRQDISLEARVIAQASTRKQAESIVHAITILTSGTIAAQGPDASGWLGANWVVNYRLHVPRHLSARLHTENGSIDVTKIDGTLTADTTNGGLTLQDLAGDVHASTVNGGLHVTLDGTQWKGAGLFAKSTNGGVSVTAPEQYSAHLVAQTVNGGITVGFPITLRGKIGNQVDTDIGHGGPTVHFQTVNGGVSIARN